MVEALIVAASEAVEGALDCLENGEMVGLEACLRSARASIAGLADAAILPDDTDMRTNTDDPTTCGHNPPHFELPGQTMCESCGASRTPDGWVVL